jgi:hypothetical protein
MAEEYSEMAAQYFWIETIYQFKMSVFALDCDGGTFDTHNYSCSTKNDKTVETKIIPQKASGFDFSRSDAVSLVCVIAESGTWRDHVVDPQLDSCFAEPIHVQSITWTRPCPICGTVQRPKLDQGKTDFEKGKPQNFSLDPRFATPLTTEEQQRTMGCCNLGLG